MDDNPEEPEDYLLLDEDDFFDIANFVEWSFARCFQVALFLLTPWRWTSALRRAVSKVANLSAGVMRTGWQASDRSEAIVHRLLYSLEFTDWLIQVALQRSRERVFTATISNLFLGLLEFLDWLAQMTLQGLLFLMLPWRWMGWFRRAIRTRRLR